MGRRNDTAILLIVCPDQPGLVATVSQFVHQNGGNIVDLDQHTDYETSTFLMRIEWELKGFALKRGELENSLQPLIKKFKMKYGLHFSSNRLRMAMLVSQYRHCLYDLLVRCALEEIQVEIPLILSNHPDLEDVAKHFAIPFHVIEVSKQNKREAEAKQIQLLEEHRVDLVVLARYMQILSADFVEHFPQRIINIHHSFLPAFVGSRPYHQAYARGVKVIGATSHYVTEQLDQGPIIEQSVTRVSHLDRVEDLIRKGRDQEKSALAYAVRMHCEHRIATYGNKTVVFE
jgi:formyltetrahydrofolate deformylase